MITTYNISYEWQGEITVEVDDTIMSDKELHELNDFWGGADSRIQQSTSVLEVVLKMLARTVLMTSLSEGGLNVYGLINRFDHDKYGQEGWPPLDGTYGLKLIAAETHIFEDDFEFEVQKLREREAE